MTFPAPARQNGDFSIVIDKESRSQNLIARRDSSWHIQKREIGGRLPQPGERWRVRITQEGPSQLTELTPVELLTVIEEYEPLPSPGGKPKNSSGKKRTEKSASEDWVVEDGLEVTLDQDQSESRLVEDDSEEEMAGSKNHLLRGKK